MNNKGLYTSAIGILIILLISANIFVFLGADKSSSNGSNVADEIMNVKTSWHKAAILAEDIVDKGYYDSVNSDCIISPTQTFNWDIVQNTIDGAVVCDITSDTLFYLSNYEVTIYCHSANNNVEYTKNFKIHKSVQTNNDPLDCKIEICDELAGSYCLEV